MTFEITDIAQLPTAPPRGGRSGPRQEVLDMLADSKSGVLSISSEDDVALKSLYHSIMQWRGRNPDSRVGIRKDGTTLYVWRTERRPKANVGVVADPAKVPARRGRPPGIGRGMAVLAEVEAIHSARKRVGGGRLK